MKRFFVIVSVFVLALSLMIVPAFGAELNSARFDFSWGSTCMQYGSFEPGDYDVAVYLDGMEVPVWNDVVTVTSDEEVAFSFPVDGGYTVWVRFTLSSSEEDVFEMEYQLNGSPVTDASGYVLITPCVAPSVSGSELFVQSIEACLVAVISWVSMLVSAFTSPQGALNGLLPLFAVVVSVPALFLGIKAVRRFIWGA